MDLALFTFEGSWSLSNTTGVFGVWGAVLEWSQGRVHLRQALLSLS